MGITVKSTTKTPEDVLKTYSGTELADYFYDEAMRVSRETATGRKIDLKTQEEVLTQIHDDYVIPLSWGENAEFWKQMYTRERNDSGRDFFLMLLDSFVKQDALISILLVEKRRTLLHEMEKTEEVRQSPEWLDQMCLEIAQVRRLKNRKKQIAAEVKSILDAPFWDTLMIARPEITLIGEEEIPPMPDGFI